MKKLASLFTLLVFLWTSFLAPVTYAQTSENLSVENPEENNLEEGSEILSNETPEIQLRAIAAPDEDLTMLLPGSSFNEKIKSLANGYDMDVYASDTNIKKVVKSNIPASNWVMTWLISTSDSEYPVYARYDNWTIYYYTKADEIYLNQDSSNMFNDMKWLTSVDIRGWDTSKVEDMYDMFFNCISLKELDVKGWDTSKVENMGYMFTNCASLKELDVSRWNTSNVTSMRDMFANNIALKELDVKGWDTSNVTNMDYMFYYDVNLRELNFSNWDTSNVRNMDYMFERCDNLETIYVSDRFVINNVYWYDMFRHAENLIWWNGTKYDSSYRDIDYANIDIDENPWYLTNISGNTAIIRFFTNGWSDMDIQVVTKWNTIESETPTKDNAIFKWWYTDEWLTKSFNTSVAINSNMKLYAKWECKQWYYDNKWKCIDESKRIEHKWWIIKITDGEKTVYIKDRNQWATQTKWSTIIHKIIKPISDKYNNWESLSLWRLYGYITENISSIAWKSIFTIWELRDYYDGNWMNIIKDIKIQNEKWNYIDAYWDYYYWWNPNSISYRNLWVKDISWYVEMWYFTNELMNWLMQSLNEYSESFFIDVPESAVEAWFSGWKILEENTWWEKWSTNNPCDNSKWEYLPTLDDWIELMQVWWNINGYEINEIKEELWEDTFIKIYSFSTWREDIINNWWVDINNLLEILNLEMAEDLMIPWAWWIVNAEEIIRFVLELQWASESNINNVVDEFVNEHGSKYLRVPLLAPLWTASESWGSVGIYLTEWWLISATSDIGAIANSIAAPVRCFVYESAWPVDETPDEKEHHYSGWWGRWGSNSKSDTEADTHWAADEQNDVDNNKKTEEKQGNTQNENKSEISIPQNNQWNKWSNSAWNEVQQAYNFAHSYGITNKTSVENAKMDNTLTRIQMAKMLSQYAINVLGKEPDVSKWVIRFSDVTNKMNKDYDNWVNLAYQLWIMWQNMKDNKFRPNDEVSRAEFVTALSRLLYSTSDGEYKSTWKYYVNHMQKLVKEWIITKDDPKMKEKRWYVMLMLMRSAK